MTAFQERVNRDKELAAVGRYFSTAIGLSFDAARHVLRVDKGQIAEIVSSPRFDVRTDFGLRAPMHVWAKFLSPDPPPLFHDLFAMLMRVPEFVLDGDTLVAMQHARALHRMMNIMRQVAPAREDAAR